MYVSAIPLLGIHPSEMKLYASTKTYIQMFKATKFIIAKNRKQPKSPSTGK